MFFKNITKKDLSRLVNVVCKNQKSTQFSGIFKVLYEEAQVGCLQRNKLLLTHKDIMNIQIMFYRETEYRLQDGHPESRIAASGLNVCSEKVSKWSPKERVVEIRSFTGVININGEQYNIPAGGALAINEHLIKSIEHDCLFIIENYEAFIAASLYFLSEEVANTLIVYRGDKEGGAVKEFIDRANIPVFGWFDSDPHGINLALATKNIVALYLPENNVDCYKKHGVEKPYYDQQKYLPNLEAKLSKSDYLSKTLSCYINSSKCLMQEAVVKHRLPLELVNLDDVN